MNEKKNNPKLSIHISKNGDFFAKKQHFLSVLFRKKKADGPTTLQIEGFRIQKISKIIKL